MVSLLSLFRQTQNVDTVEQSLLLERCVDQQIDGRDRFVAGNEALAEIAQKIVRRGLRLRGDEPTAGVGEFRLHLETWECLEDDGHLSRRNRIEAKPAIV